MKTSPPTAMSEPEKQPRVSELEPGSLALVNAEGPFRVHGPAGGIPDTLERTSTLAAVTLTHVETGVEWMVVSSGEERPHIHVRERTDRAGLHYRYRRVEAVEVVRRVSEQSRL